MTTPYDANNPAPSPPSGMPTAKVVFQPIPWESTTTTSIQDPSYYGGGVWTDYQCNLHYEGSKGVYMNGVASPNGYNGVSAIFTQLVQSTNLLVVDWTACKAGAKPQIPDPTSRDPNWVFLYELYEPSELVTDGTGDNVLYRISGCYIYGAKNTNRSLSKAIAWPIPPWLDPAVDRTFDPTEMTKGLIDGTGLTGKATGGDDAGGPGFFVGDGV